MRRALAGKRRGGSGQIQSGPLRPGRQESQPLSALFARQPDPCPSRFLPFAARPLPVWWTRSPVTVTGPCSSFQPAATS
jgi:hypothetical protein